MSAKTSRRPVSRRRPPGRRRSSAPWWFVGGLVVIAAVFVVAIVLTVGGEDDDGKAAAAGEVAASVTVSGDPLPQFTDPTDDPAVGDTMPTLEGQTFDGGEITIGPDGTPKMIVFLAHWCPHCQAEVPRIVTAADSGALPANAQIYGVATATDAARDNYPPSDWLEREGFDFPVLVDTADSTAATAYGLAGFPFIVLVDGEGTVVARSSGEVGLEGLQEMMRQLQ